MDTGTITKQIHNSSLPNTQQQLSPLISCITRNSTKYDSINFTSTNILYALYMYAYEYIMQSKASHPILNNVIGYDSNLVS